MTTVAPDKFAPPQSFGTRVQAEVTACLQMGKAGYSLTAVDVRSGEIYRVMAAPLKHQGEIVTLILKGGALLADGFWMVQE